MNTSETVSTEQCKICKKVIDRKVIITECLHSFCRDCVINIARFTNNCPKCEGTYDLIAETISKEGRVESLTTLENEEGDECCICLGEKENRAVIDSCFHSFCFKCICKWAETISECPLCRSDISEIYHNIKDDKTFQTSLVRRADKRNIHLTGSIDFNELFPVTSFQAEQNIPITTDSTSRIRARLRQFFGSNTNGTDRAPSPISVLRVEEPSFNQFGNRALFQDDDAQPSTSTGRRNPEAISFQPVRNRGLMRSQAFLDSREQRTRRRRNDYSPSFEGRFYPPHNENPLSSRSARTDDQYGAIPFSSFARIGSVRVPRSRYQTPSAESVRENLASISEARLEVPHQGIGHSSHGQAWAINGEFLRAINRRRDLNERSDSIDNILNFMPDMRLSQERMPRYMIRPKRSRWCLNCFSNGED